MPASSTSATAGPVLSKSSRTITRRSSNRFQGATTGVGGISARIFTMGARPVAVMDSPEVWTYLCSVGARDSREQGFQQGSQKDIHRNHSILEGVSAASPPTATASACPTSGGETKFEPCYSGNPLVNAFAMGLVRKDEIFYARAAGEGNR